MKKPDIIVGIPSYNESKNIPYVIRQVDQGLQKYFAQKQGLILNLDGGSRDGTRKVFTDTKTKTAKKTLSVRGLSGKGAAFRLLFTRSLKLKPKVIVVVDADLRSITPEWVKYLADPILKGYDYVTPLYARHEYDGTITNNITYPLIYGLLGYDLRQPMGGEFAFNTKLVRYWLDRKWFNSTKQYGIDSFMSFNALLNGFTLAQVGLGAKIHNPSAPKLGPMFSQVVETVFSTLSHNRAKWDKKLRSVRKIKTFCQNYIEKAQDVSLDVRTIRKTAMSEYVFSKDILKKYLNMRVFGLLDKSFQQKKPKITVNMWWKIVYDLVYAYDKYSLGPSVVDCLKPLYFARTATFVDETKKLSSTQSEKRIVKQADAFFKNRNYLLEKYKTIN